jgi:hypothetical protein
MHTGRFEEMTGSALTLRCGFAFQVGLQVAAVGEWNSLLNQVLG